MVAGAGSGAGGDEDRLLALHTPRAAVALTTLVSNMAHDRGPGMTRNWSMIYADDPEGVANGRRRQRALAHSGKGASAAGEKWNAPPMACRQRCS